MFDWEGIRCVIDDHFAYMEYTTSSQKDSDIFANKENMECYYGW